MCVRKKNRGRDIAYETFRATLADCLGQDGVTEFKFRDQWLERLREHPQLTMTGWYEPPPYGMAVFFGHDRADPPFSFASLRSPEFWPSDRVMNWRHGLMYAYCSPIHLVDKLPADFGITLYFGRDRLVRSHFATSLSITREIMREITPRTLARRLYDYSEVVFRDAGLRNNVASVSNSFAVDLGHSLPSVEAVDLASGRQLTTAAKLAVQNGRLYISADADWALSTPVQFTIEPSLVSLGKTNLPQVSPHYVVAVSEEGVTICDECDTLFSEFNLLA